MRAVNAVLTGIAIAALAVGAEARTLRNIGGPAELPSASYTGKQYVDSRGCAFIRAGYGGRVNWVPRVARNRQVVCGLKPTAGAGTAKPANTAPTRTQVASTPQQKTQSPPTRTVRPTNNNSLALFWFGNPKQSRTRTTTARATAALAPTAPVAPSKARKPKAAKVALTPALSLYEQTHLKVGSPQVDHPGDLFNGRLKLARSGAVQVTRTAPVVPAGYKSLLAETKVVMARGVGTAQGQAAMDLIWTQTMPRRLIDATTGRDMTAQLPQIRYPYTTASTKIVSNGIAAGATSSPRILKKRPLDEASPANMIKIEDVSALTYTSAADVSAAKPASHRYVQVATFGVPENATRTIAKFNERGVPTYARPISRGGRNYQIVLLGPFQKDAGLKYALGLARKSGFADAFFVK